MVETPPGLGLAVLSAPEPLHYYSLFSHTIGYDVVVSCFNAAVSRFYTAVFYIVLLAERRGLAQQALHHYLFSHTVGYDVVVSCYSVQRVHLTR
jgi:hypothetical protein